MQDGQHSTALIIGEERQKPSLTRCKVSCEDVCILAERCSASPEHLQVLCQFPSIHVLPQSLQWSGVAHKMGRHRPQTTSRAQV